MSLEHETPEKVSAKRVTASPAALVQNDAATAGSDDCLARAHVYRLLAALLVAPPDESLLRLISDLEPAQGAPQDDMAVAWHQLQQAAVQVLAQGEDVNGEYFSLFIGLGKGEISPYASWYLTGFLMEKPLADLRAVLDRLGFCRKPGVVEPEDHVGAMCELMGVIIAESVLSSNEEKLFFDQYIAPWMGRFFDDLKQADSSVFYRAVAVLGRQFIDIEQRYFSMSV